MIRALIFDFDGLILDTESTDYLSWKEAYAVHGCELPLDIWRESIGTTDRFNPFTYLESLLGQPIDRQALRAARRQRDDELLAGLTTLPGVVETLAAARQHRLKTAVASSSDHGWVDPHLQRLGLWDDLDLVRCSDDVGNLSKPNPAVYRAALAGLGVRGEEAVALEDSPHGVAAAKAAGIFAIAVPNSMTRGLDFSLADRQLDSLKGLSVERLLAEIA